MPRARRETRRVGEARETYKLQPGPVPALSSQHAAKRHRLKRAYINGRMNR